MSQHNIIGSEAFSNRPYILVRNVRPGGLRRRRSRSLAAYGVVAALALAAGVVVAAFAMGPLLVGDDAAPLSPVEGEAAPRATPSAP